MAICKVDSLHARRSAWARHESDSERQTIRFRRLSLRQINRNFLRGGIVTPASRQFRHTASRQPLLKKPAEILTGHLFHHLAKFVGGRAIVLVPAVVVANAVPEIVGANQAS